MSFSEIHSDSQADRAIDERRALLAPLEAENTKLREELRHLYDYAHKLTPPASFEVGPPPALLRVMPFLKT